MCPHVCIWDPGVHVCLGMESLRIVYLLYTHYRTSGGILDSLHNKYENIHDMSKRRSMQEQSRVIVWRLNHKSGVILIWLSQENPRAFRFWSGDALSLLVQRLPQGSPSCCHRLP